MEHTIIFTPKFAEFLRDIKSPVSEKILELQHQKTDVLINYIDLDLSKNDVITFIPESKLVGKKFNLLFNTDSGSDYNCVLAEDRHLNTLGLVEQKLDLLYPPMPSVKGSIEREFTLDEICAIYPRQTREIKNIFVAHGGLVLFRYVDDAYSLSALHHPRTVKRVRHCMVGKNSLTPDANEFPRNEMKVGRFAKRLLDKSNQSVPDKEIEDFVNKYKSLVEITNNAFLRLKMVKGEDIRKYYSHTKYDQHSGVLNGSCMKYDQCQSYLDIYVNNPDVVSMVIFMSKDGTDTISGRSIIWTDSKGRKIMDRIYVNKCSDEEIFKEMAIKEGFLYKERQTYDSNQLMINGQRLNQEDNRVIINLNPEIKYQYFPYVDTMKYYDMDRQILSSYPEIEISDESQPSGISTHMLKYILCATNGGIRNC